MTGNARDDNSEPDRVHKRWLFALGLLILIMIVMPFIARLY